jgi:DNA-binding XRE family transcriptional regulator
MPSLSSALNEHIRRLSRREAKSLTSGTRRAAARYRNEIAALKRQVGALQKTVAFLERQERNRLADQLATPIFAAENIRFRADGLRSHRAKLGLSAADYGRLVGASGLSIYHWESGKARPRKTQLPKLAAVRGLGKREALKRLTMPEAGPASTKLRLPRTGHGQTAEEFVLSLVRGKDATTSNEINAAWARAGRPGKADNTLSVMVKRGKLTRRKLKDQRGSSYVTA